MNEVWTAVLNVLAILALVAVGTFVIVLVSDLIISIIDGKNGIFFKRSKKVKDVELENDELEEKPKQLEQVKEKKQEEKHEEEAFGKSVDLELAEEERLALAGEKEIQNNAEEVDDSLKERVSALEAKENTVEPVEEKELSDEELDRMYAELIADINEQADDEEDENEKLVEDDEEINEDEEVEEKDDEKISALEDEINSLKRMLEDETKAKDDLVKEKETLTKEKEDLAKALEERPQVEIPVAVEGVELDTVEGLTKQKEDLEERLKVANKELKTNKREYLPLARIQKTLKKDEAKLRRREAVVAKKKIMLFGVTNYVVDQEKEQELAQELDQLEALRLSVQHCKEVMHENKDRYPLLESTNKILVESVANIKSDIETVDAKLEALKAKQGEGNN